MPLAGPAPPPGHGPLGDPEQGLGHDLLAHLGHPGGPLGEGDRHLRHPEPLLPGLVGHLDLEAVAAGADRLHRQRLQHLPPVGPVPGGGVVHRDPEGEPHVGVAGAGDRLPLPAPVDRPPAGHVPGPDHQVGAGQPVQQRRQPVRRVRQVGVHLDQRVIAPLQPPGEPGPVGRPQPLLARPLQQLHPGLVLAAPLHQLGRPVGAAVVDHQHVHPRVGQQHPVQHLDHRVGLVVGRNHHQRPHGFPRNGTVGSLVASRVRWPTDSSVRSEAGGPGRPTRPSRLRHSNPARTSPPTATPTIPASIPRP
jgi:hypothetical protein